MSRFKVPILIVVIALAAVACSGDDSGSSDGPFDGIGDAAEGGSGEDTDGDESSDVSLELSENVTIPLPDGGTVTASITDTGYGYAYVEYPPDRFDELVAFYNDWISTDSRDWSGSDSSFDQQGTIVRGWIWDSDASRFGIVDCATGGGGGPFDAVCVEISEWEE